MSASNKDKNKLNSNNYRVNNAQISASSMKSVKEIRERASWPVYKNYEITDAPGEPSVIAPVSSGLLFEDEFDGSRMYEARDPSEDVLTFYAPLNTPELAIELADLAEKNITPEVVLDWAKVYGLLGFPDEDVLSGRGVNVGGMGRRDRVASFVAGAEEIRTFLRVYEAMNTEDEVDFKERLHGLRAFPAEAYPDWKRRSDSDRAWYLSLLGRMVQIRLSDYCYPMLTTYTRNLYPTGRFALGWGFNGLIGAIWLHMAWLLEAEGDQVTRCRLPDCRRVIHFEPGSFAPKPSKIDSADEETKRNPRGTYKTRSDRSFCKGRGCKQKYHYRKNAGWTGYH